MCYAEVLVACDKPIINFALTIMDKEQFFQVNFIGEKLVRIKEGQTILSAALDAGIPHFNACGGKAQCSTCRVMVAEGANNVTP
ncbi:MAG: 2Fe-2S iron-sulfur cluster-binding protein, partial [Chitinophagaceae bacterium]